MTRSPPLSTIAAIGALCAATLSFVSGRASWWSGLDRGVSDWAIRRQAAPDPARPKVFVVLTQQPLEAPNLGDLINRIAEHSPASILIDQPIDSAKGLVRALERTPCSVGVLPGPSPTDPTAWTTTFGDASELQEVPTITPLPPAIADAADAIGLAGTPADEDGVVRRVPLVRRAPEAEQTVVGSAIAGLIAAYGDRSLQLGGDGQSLLGFCGTDVPMNQDGSLALRFRGPTGSLDTIYLDPTTSFEKVQAGDLIVIGIADDTVRTPTDENMPHAEVVATAVDNLLRGDPLRIAHPALALLHAALVGALGALVIGLGNRAGLLRAAAVLLIATIGPVIAFISLGQILSGSSALVSGAFGAGGALAARRAAERVDNSPAGDVKGNPSS